MSTKRYKNFDELRKARQDKELEYVLFGETYNLPPTLPYDVVLWFSSMRKRDKSDVIEDSEVVTIFSAIFGEDNTEKWRKQGLDILSMTEMMGWAFEEYGITSPNGMSAQGQNQAQ